MNWMLALLLALGLGVTAYDVGGGGPPLSGPTTFDVGGGGPPHP